MRLKAATIGGIITAALLCVLSSSSVTTDALPGDVIDQQWDGYAPKGTSYSGRMINDAEPVGETFVPSSPLLAAVEARLYRSYEPVGDAVVTANIRLGTIDGPIVGTKSLTVPERIAGWIRWVFDKPLAVVPGETYVLELDSANSTHVWEVTHPGYGNGFGVVNGNPMDDWDFSFRTYSASAQVPDPTPWPTPGGPQTPPFDVFVSVDRVEPGGEVTVLVYADNVQEPGIGSWTIYLKYDEQLVSPTSCAAVRGICHFHSDPIIHYAGSFNPGLTGDVVIARPTFEAGSKEGVAELGFDIVGMVTPGGLSIDVTPHAGSLTVTTGRPFGDVLCDGAVDPADALAILRSQTSLAPVPQNEPCTNIGHSRFNNIVGDLDCDNDVDSVDALAALRAATSLPPLAQHEPCPDVGSHL